MGKLVIWTVIILAIFYAFKAGYLNSFLHYLSDSVEPKQEEVIQNADGSYSTVRYKNIFDLLLGK